MKQKSLGVKARKRIGSVVYHCFMVLLSLTMIYPFVWSVLSSFKTSEQLYGGSPLDLLPKPGWHRHWPRSIWSRSTPRSRAPMLSPA